MKPVTVAIRQDEMAWELREFNKAGVGYRRYQVITVVRDDKLTEWWDDLGPAAEFFGEGFIIPSLFEHSVAELREMAEIAREDNGFEDFAAEQQAESTLISDYINQMEERWEVIYNRSTFGPGGQTQRNGFPRKEVLDVYGKRRGS